MLMEVGAVFHEQQRLLLCGVHCLNALFCNQIPARRGAAGMPPLYSKVHETYLFKWCARRFCRGRLYPAAVMCALTNDWRLLIRVRSTRSRRSGTARHASWASRAAS